MPAIGTPPKDRQTTLADGPDFGVHYTGSSYLSLKIDAKVDNLIEGTEGFQLSIAPGDYLIGSSGGSGGGYQDVRINDDPPTVSFGYMYNYGGISDGNTGYVSLYRSGGDYSQALTVNLTLDSDSQDDPLAAWGTDYNLILMNGGSSSLASTGGTLTFAVGSS